MATTYFDAITKTVDVNGTSFVYREAGEKNGIPVVLLHHLTAVLDDWDPRTIDSGSPTCPAPPTTQISAEPTPAGIDLWISLCAALAATQCPAPRPVPARPVETAKRLLYSLHPVVLLL